MDKSEKFKPDEETIEFWRGAFNTLLCHGFHASPLGGMLVNSRIHMLPKEEALEEN